jgi:hypothetical protein
VFKPHESCPPNLYQCLRKPAMSQNQPEGRPPWSAHSAMSITQDFLLESRNMASVLTCWKEISSYVGKGVRTIQRWESEFGFPIRRSKPGTKSFVLAIPAEIDAWIQAQQLSDGQLNSVQSERTAFFRTVRELRSEIRKSAASTPTGARTNESEHV